MFKALYIKAMIKIFFLMLILAGISTKTIQDLNFNEETSFDKNNNEFSFEYNTYGPLITYVSQ